MWGYGVSRPNKEGPLPSGGPALLSFISIRGLSPGPLFIWEDGSQLTRAAMVKEIQSALASVDIDPTPYSGHSFRIGAATTAAAARIEDTVGRRQSSAYQRYIRFPQVP